MSIFGSILSSFRESVLNQSSSVSGYVEQVEIGFENRKDQLQILCCHENNASRVRWMSNPDLQFPISGYYITEQKNSYSLSFSNDLIPIRQFNQSETFELYPLMLMIVSWSDIAIRGVLDGGLKSILIPKNATIEFSFANKPRQVRLRFKQSVSLTLDVIFSNNSRRQFYVNSDFYLISENLSIQKITILNNPNADPVILTELEFWWDRFTKIVNDGPFFLPRTDSWQNFERDLNAREILGGPWFTPPHQQSEFESLMKMIRIIDPRTYQYNDSSGNPVITAVPNENVPNRTELEDLVRYLADFFDNDYQDDEDLAATIWGADSTPFDISTMISDHFTQILEFYYNQCKESLYALSMRIEYAALLGLFVKIDHSNQKNIPIEYGVMALFVGNTMFRDSCPNESCIPPSVTGFTSRKTEQSKTMHPSFDNRIPSPSNTWTNWRYPPILAKNQPDGTPFEIESYIPRYDSYGTGLNWNQAEDSSQLMHKDSILYRIERFEHGIGSVSSSTIPALPADPNWVDLFDGNLFLPPDPEMYEEEGESDFWEDEDPVVSQPEHASYSSLLAEGQAIMKPLYIDDRHQRFPELEGWVRYRIFGVNILGVISTTPATTQILHKDEIIPPHPATFARKVLAPAATTSPDNHYTFDANDTLEVDCQISWVHAEDFVAPDTKEFRVYSRWILPQYLQIQTTTVEPHLNQNGQVDGSIVRVLGGISQPANYFEGYKISTSDRTYPIISNTSGVEGYFVVANYNGEPIPPNTVGLIQWFPNNGNLEENYIVLPNGEKILRVSNHRIKIIPKKNRWLGTVSDIAIQKIGNIISEIRITVSKEPGQPDLGDNIYKNGSLYIHGLRDSLNAISLVSNNVLSVKPLDYNYQILTGLSIGNSSVADLIKQDKSNAEGIILEVVPSQNEIHVKSKNNIPFNDSDEIANMTKDSTGATKIGTPSSINAVYDPENHPDWWIEWIQTANFRDGLIGSPVVYYPDHLERLSFSKPANFSTQGKLELFVSSADDASYVTENVSDFSSDDPALLGKNGNEGEQLPTPQILVMSNSPPSPPSAPPFDPNRTIWAKRASNFDESSRYLLSWTSQLGKRYRIYRAFASAIILKHRNQSGTFAASNDGTRKLNEAEYSDEQLYDLVSQSTDYDSLFESVHLGGIIADHFEDKIPGKNGGRVLYKIKALDDTEREGSFSDPFGPVHIPIITPLPKPILRRVTINDDKDTNGNYVDDRTIILEFSQSGHDSSTYFEIYRTEEENHARDIRLMNSPTATLSINDSQIIKNSNLPNEFKFKDTNLVPQRKYYYRIRSLRRVPDPNFETGTNTEDIFSGQSNMLFTHAPLFTLPAAPSNVTLQFASSNTVVNIQWNNSVNWYTSITIIKKYQGRMKLFKVIENLPWNTTTFNDSLSSNETGKIFYKIRAFIGSQFIDSDFKEIDI